MGKIASREARRTGGRGNYPIPRQKRLRASLKTAVRRVENNSIAISRMAGHYLLPAIGKAENQCFGKFICTIGLNDISLHPKNQHVKP